MIHVFNHFGKIPKKIGQNLAKNQQNSGKSAKFVNCYSKKFSNS